MSRAAAALLLSWWLAAGQAAAQAPVPVVERIATDMGRTTRVSLFSNRVAVVSVHSEHDNFIRQAVLAEDEYMVYLQALDRLAGEIDDEPVSSDVASRGSRTSLTLHVGPGAPRTLAYSPLAVLDLALGKVAAVMDDIQVRVLATRPGEDAVRQWQPEVGDVVTLIHGTAARVVEIVGDGTLLLAEEETGLMLSVAPEDRASVIREPG
ncbi:MAG TPA: hypothetical protein VLT32_14605, partial [Candidatus Sulfomarinibacteraceae bacterium]|nr:hypothetical protein [Candidatus Sulfomarinibacteraceae bacterium]